MPKPERYLTVTPGHNCRKIGFCNACIRTFDSHGNPLKEKDPEVWEICLNQAVVRLCDACMDAFMEQVHLHKTRRKAGKKR